MIVGVGAPLSSLRETGERLKSLIEELLALRSIFRQDNHWEKADEIRACLEKCNIIVDDSASGSSWRFRE